MTEIVRCVLLLTFLVNATRESKMEVFIVGGGEAPINEYPHSVFFLLNCSDLTICGGAILNQEMVLTAAHCVFDCQIPSMNGHHADVYVGNSNLTQVQTKRTLTRFVVHQKYNENTVHNDIAIAMLNKAIPFGTNIKRVIIPKRFPPTAGFAKVAGWGTVNEDTGATSMILKQVEQKLRSVATCKKLGDLPISTFCAGSENYYEDRPAQGDSGSALITDDYSEIGIVSFRIPPYPALMVYTNVSYYYTWVSSQAKKIFCDSKK